MSSPLIIKFWQLPATLSNKRKAYDMGFFPHDLAGWLTVLATLSAAMWFVIRVTFVKAIDSLNKTIASLQDTLKVYDSRLDDHEKRISIIEDWREHHDDNE